jgi:hypothetical protein
VVERASRYAGKRGRTISRVRSSEMSWPLHGPRIVPPRTDAPTEGRFSGKWVAMHGSMKGYWEVRVMGPRRTLYRVFCLLERMSPGLGLADHSIVAIDGMSKPSGTAFTERDYAAVRRLGDEYRCSTPRSVI